MSDLTEFLRARLDEDQATALAGRRVNAAWPDDGAQLGLVWSFGTNYLVSTPDRVQAEVEAKVALVQLASDAENDGWAPHILGAIALAYRWHPDYREEEWAP